jgi:hypothetical protein
MLARIERARRDPVHRYQALFAMAGKRFRRHAGAGAAGLLRMIADQGGVIAYRFLVNYGGKRLMCHGSLYKDQASAALGDLRDKVLIQAKKICETLAL